MRKVLIGPSTFCKLDRRPLDRLREAGYEVIDNPYKRRLAKSELMDLLAGGVNGLVAGLEPLDREVLQKSALKVISRCGAGMSNVDLAAANELNIKVRLTPDVPTTAVAELTLGMLLSLVRMAHQLDRDLHEGKWNKEIIGAQIEGKTAAIIGFGRIGRKVASLLKAFNVKIIAVDPALGGDPEGVKVFSIDKALKEADIISIHASGEKEIIGKEEFRYIKKGSFLLNAARGGAVSEKALIQSLEKGQIKGAWLDTFTSEPYSGPLKKFPQVILTPHVGSYTRECRSEMEMRAVDNLISAFKEVE